MLKNKKATKHRVDVRKWRQGYKRLGLTYRKIKNHYAWTPKRR